MCRENRRKKTRHCEHKTGLNSFITTWVLLVSVVGFVVSFALKPQKPLIIRDGARWRFRTSDPYRVKVMLYH